MKIVNSHLLSGFDNTLRNVISREQFYMFSFFIFQQEAKAGERLNLVFSPHFFIVIISNKTSSFLVISRLRPHSNKCSHFSWMRFPIRSIKWKRLEWILENYFTTAQRPPSRYCSWAFYFVRLFCKTRFLMTIWAPLTCKYFKRI